MHTLLILTGAHFESTLHYKGFLGVTFLINKKTLSVMYTLSILTGAHFAYYAFYERISRRINESFD